MEAQLTALQGELKSYFEKAADEKTRLGTVLEATQNKLTALQTQLDAVDQKVSANRITSAEDGKTLLDEFKANESVQRLIRDGSGRALITLTGKNASDMLERKTTITSAAVGQAISGVLQVDRIPGIVYDARQQLTIRDLLYARPTSMQLVDFVKVLSRMAPASPQVEAAVKAENAVTFQSVSTPVKTIATWIPATKQILSDFTELLSFLQTELPFRVNQEEEIQLLSGDGTGENLNGLITQSAAFSTGLVSNTAGWNKMDIIGRVIQQITAANEFPPTFIVVNPTDWWGIRLTKDSYGRYLLGDIMQGSGATAGFGTSSPTQNLFGLTVAATTNMPAGNFLVGSGNPAAAEIRDRLEMQVDISTEHSDFFTRNMVAIRAEKRLALVVKRPASFVHGTFSSSPA